MFSWLRRPAAAAYWPPAATGLYLYGGVGRGKTWLMDLFHGALEDVAPGTARRTHFHRFMLDVSARLKPLRDMQDPLAHVADEIAAETRMLCFDEFHVSDIADAMILSGLLHALLERNVGIVATSNDAPSALYHDGLQRARFLPAIALIEQRLVVCHLDSPTDYRLRTLTDAKLYHSPHDADSDARLAADFHRLAPLAMVEGGALDVNGRPVTVRAHGEGVVWFDFEAICETARSPADYLEIARCFHSVLLGAVPRLDDERRDATLRFIHLVDVLYDQRVKLIVSAQAQAADLYAGNRLAARFRRTVSRLSEMRSVEYLAMAHLPGEARASTTRSRECDPAHVFSD